MCKAFLTKIRKKFYFVIIVNHGIRKNSKSECLFVKKKIFEKQEIKLKIITNKKKITNNIQHLARKVRYHIA